MKPGDSLELRVYSALLVELEKGYLGLAPESCRIYRQRRYYSSLRKRWLAVDISIEVFQKGCQSPSIIWVWECKEYSGSIPVRELEVFHSVLEQLGPAKTKGTMISSQGLFDAAAWEYAKSQGIGIARLLPDARIDHSLPTYNFEGALLLIGVGVFGMLDFLLHRRGRSLREYLDEKENQASMALARRALCDASFAGKSHFYGLSTSGRLTEDIGSLIWLEFINMGVVPERESAIKGGIGEAIRTILAYVVTMAMIAVPIYLVTYTQVREWSLGSQLLLTGSILIGGGALLFIGIVNDPFPWESRLEGLREVGGCFWAFAKVCLFAFFLCGLVAAILALIGA